MYNSEKNTDNWASWIINQSWLYDDSVDSDSLRFGEVESRDLKEDQTLPKDFYQVLKHDYQRFVLDQFGDIKD